MQLNVEQRRIIESKPNGHTLIKGVAGSGKTTVAVNKIPLLLRHYCAAEDDKVLMATYNKSLSKYVAYIYENTKEEHNVQGGFFDEENDNKLEIKTIDSLMFYYFNLYKKDTHMKVELATAHECQAALIDAITTVSKKMANVKIIDPKFLYFIKEEIIRIKSCNYTELQEYQEVDRIGRVTKVNNDGPQKLRKNSDQRYAIYEVLTQYNKNLESNNKIDFQDMALLALKQANRKAVKKYTHILIDESQDLSRVQLEFLRALYNEKKYSSITFIADVAQSIYPQAWLVKNRSFTTIGYDMTGKSNSLSKNYRTTTQIAQAAFSLIKKDEDLLEDSNFVRPSLIDKQGEYPIYKCFNNKDEEGKYVADLINTNLKNRYSLKDIVIIGRLKGQLKEIKTYLDSIGIPCSIFDGKEEFDFAEDAVKLVTMHSIKGLEFKVVIIIGLNSKVMPFISSSREVEDLEMVESRERKLLYVGMTRATEKLYISSDGAPSKFIKDIDYQFLRIKENCSMRRISTINIEKYLLKDQIPDIYSEEEKIRQWVLRELKEVYKYPLDLIKLEEKINMGSRIGLADIAVNIYRKKVKAPYILVETKRWGMGIDGALSQLKSYISNSPSVQYGIATDGNEIVIINRDLEEISDIPKFDVSMIPSTLETVEFIDIRKNISHKFIKDSTVTGEIYIEDNGVEKKVDNLRSIPVYNEIAAGMPILINNEFQGKYFLPSEWLGTLNNLFILKIKGESMINKNINDGDYVVINKQDCANIGDIVAVDIEGNATLKTYKTMGGKILLMPENDDYEPIMLEEEQFSIIGVAVGIIKEN